MIETEHTDEAAGFTFRRVAANGISLHLAEGGDGPLMLLVSGWPQTLYSWRKVMPALARHFHVVAVDLPGLGGSDFPNGGYDTAAISFHLDAVLDEFGARDCILVTHDIGAWVGYAYAVRRSQRVRRLVLIDGAIPGVAPPEAYRLTPETAHRMWHFAFNYLPELPELLITGRESAFLTWLFRAKTVDFDTAFDGAALEVYTKAYALPGRWSGGMGYYRAYFTSAEQNRVTIQTPLLMPVLAIGGAQSLGSAMAHSAGQVAAHVQSSVIEACGHYVPEEQPQALLSTLLPFCLAEPAIAQG